jgi:hypothetical protein
MSLMVCDLVVTDENWDCAFFFWLQSTRIDKTLSLLELETVSLVGTCFMHFVNCHPFSNIFCGQKFISRYSESGLFVPLDASFWEKSMTSSRIC